MKSTKKPAPKKVIQAIQNLIEDKSYIKSQIKKGEPIDSSKLKAGKIANITL